MFHHLNSLLRGHDRIEFLECGWTLEDNHDINQLLIELGAKKYSVYRIFRKSFLIIGTILGCMLKVLLINPEFPISYWSFPELLKFPDAKTMNPPLGLLTVAALLPSDWDIRLVDLATQPRSDIDWNWPDLVMISAMLIQKNNFIELIREAKNRGKTVVVGGPYPTSVPEDSLAAGCDFLVRGEGENTIPLLLESLRTGTSRAPL